MRKLSTLLIILSVMTVISCSKGKKNMGDNPFLVEWDTPYGIPPFDQIKPEHYKPALEKGMELHLAEIDSIINNSAEANFDNTILALDNAGELFSKASSVFSLISTAESNDKIKAIEKEMSPKLAAHSDNIYLNEALYQRVKKVYDNRLNAGLNPLQIRLVEKTHERFTRAGTHLSNSDKTILRKINEDLAQAQVKFGTNLQDATKGFLMVVDTTDVQGLSNDVKRSAMALAEKNGEPGRYAFSTDKPSMLPFLTNSPREDLREKLYRGYIERCEAGSEWDNSEVVNEIVRLRTERANLMGYKTHAHYVLEERMAETPENAYDLLNQVWTPALNLAKEELAEMKEIKKRETGSEEFHSWDWWYYAEKVRKEKYALDEQMIRPYFSLENVRSGIFELSNRLYGLTFTPISNAPVYHKDCMVYQVLDKNNQHLAVLIMDFFPRDGKRVGAWCGSYRTRKYNNDNGVKERDPVVTIVCNFTEPSDSRPALLTLDETETFFHEFGHALHTFFTDVPYQGLIRVERDFVELPSQIMENWAFEPQVLRKYAIHHSTNAVIPESLIEKINNSSHFNLGFATTELVASSFSDMDIYSIENFKPVVLRDFETEMLNTKRGLIKEIEPRYRYPYFNHVFRGGYSAGYYSYLWSEVLDKDAYEAFVESGDIFNPKVATAFRDEILSKGGSLDGKELYHNFRGKDADTKYLLYGRGLVERPKSAEVDQLVIVQEIASDVKSEVDDENVDE